VISVFPARIAGSRLPISSTRVNPPIPRKAKLCLTTLPLRLRPSPDNDDEKKPPAPENNVIHLHGPTEPPHEPKTDEANATGETDAEGEKGDGEEDDFDDEAPDTLDKAAARIRHDYERRTLPYPEPVDGVELLNELVAASDRFMVLPPGASETLALWVVLTYCLYPSGMRFAPRLIVRKPVSNSGGTNLTILLLHLIRRPKYNSGMTDASFYRQANRRLTGIIDECDNPPLRSNYKLVRMINAGHGSTGTEPRTEHVGGKRVTVYYPTSARFVCAASAILPRSRCAIARSSSHSNGKWSVRMLTSSTLPITPR
jgi:hypothetical protein